LAPAFTIYNSITFVMNWLFLIFSDPYFEDYFFLYITQLFLQKGSVITQP
jgi:hypothetical protein